MLRVQVRRGYWGNKIGLPHTVPMKITAKCGSIRMRIVPAPKGTGIVAARAPKKVTPPPPPPLTPRALPDTHTLGTHALHIVAQVYVYMSTSSHKRAHTHSLKHRIDRVRRTGARVRRPQRLLHLVARLDQDSRQLRQGHVLLHPQAVRSARCSGVPGLGSPRSHICAGTVHTVRAGSPSFRFALACGACEPRTRVAAAPEILSVPFSHFPYPCSH